MEAASFNMHEAKTNLSKLVERASHGEEIIIAKAGKPKAKLVPADDSQRQERRKPEIGYAAGQGWIAPDFDEIPPGFEPYI